MKQNKGTIRVLRHESNALSGNPLGDPHERDLYVYLPPGYDEDTERKYPVVHCLTGFTGRGKMYLNDSAFSPNLAERIDSLIGAARVRPFIAVLPDCFTRYGGSQYVNSSATGNYEDYFTEELVPFVDENFRTLADRRSRAVVGKSSGGYGAFVMAMRHADIFSAAASIAGDCYFEICYKPDMSKAFRAIAGEPLKLIEKFWDEETVKNKNEFDGLNIIGMASCYSPNPDSKWGFDLPFDVATGEILEDVWERWLEHDPALIAEAHIDALKSLALLYIDAGTSDEFGLDIGARVMSKRLADLGVPHVTEEFEGGHFNINYRYDKAFEAISEAMRTED